VSDDARPISAAEWAALAWLGIPVAERGGWCFAPAKMNYGQAEEWARVAQCIFLASGDTLVRRSARAARLDDPMVHQVTSRYVGDA
jgi:hypothetical protein